MHANSNLAASKVMFVEERNFLKVSGNSVFAAILSIATVVFLLAASPAAAQSAKDAHPEDTLIELLFVQHAANVTLENNLLKLEGISQSILYFSDRPARIVGREPLVDFIGSWGEGKNSFSEVPPNAVVTVVSESNYIDAVVVLKDPKLIGDTLEYTVEVLDGPEIGKGENAALFIDAVGLPGVHGVGSPGSPGLPGVTGVGSTGSPGSPGSPGVYGVGSAGSPGLPGRRQGRSNARTVRR